MLEIIYTKPFAGKKKGDSDTLDSMLVARLIAAKVAKLKPAKK